MQCVFLFAVLYLLYVLFYFYLFYLLYASGKDAVILGYFGVLLFGLVLDGRIGLGRIAWIGWVW